MTPKLQPSRVVGVDLVASGPPSLCLTGVLGEVEAVNRGVVGALITGSALRRLSGPTSDRVGAAGDARVIDGAGGLAGFGVLGEALRQLRVQGEGFVALAAGGRQKVLQRIELFRGDHEWLADVRHRGSSGCLAFGPFPYLLASIIRYAYLIVKRYADICTRIAYGRLAL